MPKRKEPELDPKEQFKRFQEAAKAAGVEDKKAKDAFASLAKKPRAKSSTTSDGT